VLHTGADHLGKNRTAVCCLSSVNAETFLEWRDHPTFIEDVMRFLDNVLQDFIDRAPSEMDPAIYAAMRERSVGLGLMGFHSFLQAQNVPFESALAKSWNMRVFKHLRREADKASKLLAEERGPCPDAADAGVMERFSHKLAIAPTASISIICGGTSACIEPIPANIYTHKTLSGSFVVKNPYLEKLLQSKSKDSTNVWNSILERGGSVQHLDFLSPEEKAVYKTSFEIDQRWLLEFAADRTPYIDQAQSLNLYIPADVDKWDLMMLHFQAWEKGIKSLYYLRSKSVQRAGFAGVVHLLLVVAGGEAALRLVHALREAHEGRQLCILLLLHEPQEALVRRVTSLVRLTRRDVRIAEKSRKCKRRLSELFWKFGIVDHLCRPYAPAALEFLDASAPLEPKSGSECSRLRERGKW
jgi:ribonucleoside-diphosphate reductase alpha chain